MLTGMVLTGYSFCMSSGKPIVHYAVSYLNRSVFIDYPPQDVLQRFICGFGQSVGLRIIRGASFMYYRIERCQAFHDLSEEMSALVAD